MITGTSKGEIVIWKGLSFDFEKTNDVHKTSIQAMKWSNYEKYLVTGDKNGQVIYSSKKLSQKNEFAAHSEAIKDIAFSPSSLKMITCSDDATAKIWDFATSTEEILFDKHGSDVKSCDWHPTKSMIATGSKDNCVKLWDARTGKEFENI